MLYIIIMSKLLYYIILNSAAYPQKNGQAELTWWLDTQSNVNVGRKVDFVANNNESTCIQYKQKQPSLSPEVSKINGRIDTYIK